MLGAKLVSKCDIKNKHNDSKKRLLQLMLARNALETNDILIIAYNLHRTST